MSQNRNVRALLTFSCLVLLPLQLLFAQPLDPVLAKGFDHFYNVEYEEALTSFRDAVRSSPEDAARRTALAQGILYYAMYRAGALESEFVTGNNPFLRRPKMEPTPAEQKEFDDAITKAIEISQTRLNRDKNDIEALYNMGVALGLRGNYNFLVRKAWMDALKDATAGRKLHNRLSEIKPDFIDARLLQGAHDYIVGSLPWHIKMLGFLAGIRGDKDSGIRTLKLVAEKGIRNKVDAEILLAVIYRREKRPREAIPLINNMLGRYPRNFLLLFELAQMHGDLGEYDAAIAAIDRVEKLKRSGAPGYRSMPMEKVYYARGNLQFWFNKLEPAIANLKLVTAKAADLDPTTGVYSWLRLGQSLDLAGKRSEALQAYRQAISYAPESDAAKESRRYLSSAYRRENKG